MPWGLCQLRSSQHHFCFHNGSRDFSCRFSPLLWWLVYLAHFLLCSPFGTLRLDFSFSFPSELIYFSCGITKSPNSCPHIPSCSTPPHSISHTELLEIFNAHKIKSESSFLNVAFLMSHGLSSACLFPVISVLLPVSLSYLATLDCIYFFQCGTSYPLEDFAWDAHSTQDVISPSISLPPFAFLTQLTHS